MTKYFLKILFFYLIFLCTQVLLWADTPIAISKEAATKIGQRIWHNECSSKVNRLTSWNEGEEFASLGIGHFIWYPNDTPIVFEQTFPSLITFFQENNVTLPLWLKTAHACPWKSRQEFLSHQNSPEMIELRKILVDHMHVQVLFMIQRLQKALPSMLQHAHQDKKELISRHFKKLSATPQGLYVLLDYLNFKGEGTSPKERYHGEGWGLLQVLEAIPGEENEDQLIERFVVTAKNLLNRRVQNAPVQRNEQRWLKGWFQRLDDYIPK